MNLEHFKRYPEYKPGEKMIIRLDPTTLNLANCSKAFELHNLMGMVTKKKDHIPEYGQAVHIMAADLQRGVKPLVAISTGLDYFVAQDLETDWRDEIHLHKVLHKYATKYLHDDFAAMRDNKGDYGVELPFAIPLITTDWCDILLSGVIDSVGHLGSLPCFKDIKCTSKWNATSFIESYRKSIQFKVYSYVLKTMGFTPYLPPVMIDCVFLKNDDTFCELKRSMLMDFTEEEVEETMTWVRAKALELATNMRDNIFLKNTTNCNLHSEDGCKFKGLCWGTDGMKMFAGQRFKQRLYDPAKFGKNEDTIEP